MQLSLSWLFEGEENPQKCRGSKSESQVTVFKSKWVLKTEDGEFTKELLSNFKIIFNGANTLDTSVNALSEIVWKAEFLGTN